MYRQLFRSSVYHPVSLVVLLFSLAACGGAPPAPPAAELAPASPAASAPTPNAAKPLETEAIAPADQPQSLTTQAPPPASPTQIAATIYTTDASCENLVPRQVDVNAQTPINAVVGAVVEAQAIPELELEGYSVALNPDTGLVTVDFRVKPQSPRHLVSLSSCEQLALFGGIRETLTEDTRWQVNDVRFTERGEEILL